MFEGPSAVTVKSNPEPVSGIVAGALSMALETVRVPLAGPAAVGSNSTPTVQLVFGASAAIHALLTTSKPVEAATLMPESMLVGSVLVMVTMVGLLVSPTPVTGKAIEDGLNWMLPVSPPVPLRETVADAIADVELTAS